MRQDFKEEIFEIQISKDIRTLVPRTLRRKSFLKIILCKSTFIAKSWLETDKPWPAYSADKDE